MNTHFILLFLICFILSSFAPAYSQQTVFNVPSADVTPKGKIFLQHESQLKPWVSEAAWNSTHYSAYGIGHNTELDMTLFNVNIPYKNRTALGVGFKSAFLIPGLKEKYPKREYKLTIGSEVITSFGREGVGNLSYAHLSGRVPVTNTRLTAGVLSGTKQVFGKNMFCFISAIEQPITEKFSLLADWYSGEEHFAGFLISGFSYKMPKESTLFVGYRLPNGPRSGRPALIIEIAKII